MAATAALYSWLQGKCAQAGGSLADHAVSVEHWPDDERVKRPVDVRLAGPASVACDYLLLDRLLRWDERDGWDAHARTAKLRPVGLGRRFNLYRNGVALAEDEWPAADERVEAELQPQEQWAARPSEHARPAHLGPHDAALLEDSPGGIEVWGSVVHFLVSRCAPPRPAPEHWQVVTIRLSPHLAARHQPATVLRTPLADVLIDPRDGGFVHPGEHERLVMWRGEVQAARELLLERRRTAAESAKRAAEAAEAARRRRQAHQRQIMPRLVAPEPLAVPAAPPPATAIPHRTAGYDGRAREGTCRICGRRTREWWVYFGADGTCKCNACRDGTGSS